MSYPRFVVPAVFLSLAASAQSVVSTHSGVIHFSEGAVFLDNQRLEQKFGRFAEIKQGSELSTDSGRAEVLLTPGTFLRVAENSVIRMVSNRLSDTRVELVAGSAILEATQLEPGTSVVILSKGSEIHFHRAGLYRFDAQPPALKVEQGEAEVVGQGAAKTVGQGYVLSLATPDAKPRAIADMGDAFDRWAMRRSISVAANDATAAQAEDMAVLLDTPMDPYNLGVAYPTVPYGPAIGAYPLGGYGYPGYGGYYGSYLGLGPYAPFLVPRVRTYLPPVYSGYRGYRTYTPIQPVRPPAFRPPSRIYSPPSRPVIMSPSVPRGGGVHVGGHR